MRMFIPPRSQDWENAVDKALEIWKHRRDGIRDETDCPLCDLSNKLEYEHHSSELDKDINGKPAHCYCIIRHCHKTPYGLYSDHSNMEYVMGDIEDDMIDSTVRIDRYAAGEMVKMLEAYKNNDMPAFFTYMRFVDDWNAKYKI
jgi:hypothetical protein